MDLEQANEILSRIRYKTHFSGQVYNYSNASYPNFKHILVVEFTVQPGPETTTSALTRMLEHSAQGLKGLINVATHKELNLDSMNEMEFLATVYSLFTEFEIHECTEFFQYKGETIFNSHHLLNDNGMNVVAPTLKDINDLYVVNIKRMERDTRDFYNEINKYRSMTIPDFIWFRIKQDVNEFIKLTKEIVGEICNKIKWRNTGPLLTFEVSSTTRESSKEVT